MTFPMRKATGTFPASPQFKIVRGVTPSGPAISEAETRERRGVSGVFGWFVFTPRK